jgi:hypothetical protein
MVVASQKRGDRRQDDGGPQNVEKIEVVNRTNDIREEEIEGEAQ